MLESLTTYNENDKVINAYKSMYKKYMVVETTPNNGLNTDYDTLLQNIKDGKVTEHDTLLQKVYIDSGSGDGRIEAELYALAFDSLMKHINDKNYRIMWKAVYEGGYANGLDFDGSITYNNKYFENLKKFKTGKEFVKQLNLANKNNERLEV
jgi:hypothetical protein